MFEFFRVFAGPIATIVASMAAVIVTVYFNKRQTAIAEAQKNIALDKLKHDLFDYRKEIYNAAKDLLNCASRYSYEKTSSEKIVEMKVKLDESRFFFPPKIQALALEIETSCESVMHQIDKRALQNSDDVEAWTESGDQLAKSESDLRHLYASLPGRFESDLRFDQLTRASN